MELSRHRETGRWSIQAQGPRVRVRVRVRKLYADLCKHKVLSYVLENVTNPNPNPNPKVKYVLENDVTNLELDFTDVFDDRPAELDQDQDQDQDQERSDEGGVSVEKKTQSRKEKDEKKEKKWSRREEARRRTALRSRRVELKQGGEA